MEKQINKEYRNRLTELNEKLMEEEFTLDRLNNAVSAARHYLAAEPDNDERVLNLHGAISNRNAQYKKVQSIREEFENMVNNVFANMEG